MRAPKGMNLPGADSPMVDFLRPVGQEDMVPNNPINVKTFTPGGPKVMARLYDGEPSMVVDDTRFGLYPAQPAYLARGRGRNANMAPGVPRETVDRWQGRVANPYAAPMAASEQKTKPSPKPRRGMDTSYGGTRQRFAGQGDGSPYA